MRSLELKAGETLIISTGKDGDLTSGLIYIATKRCPGCGEKTVSESTWGEYDALTRLRAAHERHKLDMHPVGVFQYSLP